MALKMKAGSLNYRDTAVVKGAYAAPRLPAVVLGIGRLPAPKLPADLSYGLYIYAFPLQQVLSAHGVLSLWASMAVTLPFAAASWFLIEKPALRLKPSPSRHPRA